MHFWPWERWRGRQTAKPTIAQFHLPATSTTSPTLTLPYPVISNTAASSRKRQKSSRINSLHVHWDRVKRRIGPVSYPDADLTASTESLPESLRSASLNRNSCPSPPPSEVVDQIVVDRRWTEDVRPSDLMEGSPEKSSASQPPLLSQDPSESFELQDPWSPWSTLRWRVWPALSEFFDSRFHDEAAEARYQQDTWATRKPLALWASLWFILNYVLGCAFAARPEDYLLPDKIFYFGIATALTIPIIFLVLFDLPRFRRGWYQVFISVSCWMWPTYQVVFMYMCSFYEDPKREPTHKTFDCDNREFLTILYYATALQVIALFGLYQGRLAASVGTVAFIVVSCALIMPDRVLWIRSIINHISFHAFLIYIHYSTEAASRRLFKLREERGVQLKAMRRAQANERLAADSKKRLTSYVFHEVRVPLNTALLAVQNMQAERLNSDNPTRSIGDSDIEWSALEGSLSMMSKVLNDVLDFDRMDSGKFESANRPYAFHQVMRSLFVPLQLATAARQLEFVTEFDPAIDRAARCAAYSAMGESAESMHKHLKAFPDVDGVVIGDEARLRQIITNLASNACKFTPPGGRLIITTRLIEPQNDEIFRSISPEPSVSGHPLSSSHLSQHTQIQEPPHQLTRIVVRIEVTDTGCGIKPEDMSGAGGDGLFSAFNQTELGRTQGGKGTGLGLALVRQIVKLSGGRLGLRSKAGEGSTFWVELPLGVGRETLREQTGLEGVNEPETLEKIDLQPDIATEFQPETTLLTAVDAAALKATQSPPPSTRSNSALHSLMEQGGRVELLLSKSPSSGSLDNMSGENTLRRSVSKPESTGPERPQLVHTPSSGQTVSSSKLISRPTFVALPGPPRFCLDANGAPIPGTPPSQCSSQMSTLDRSKPASTPGSPIYHLHVLVVDDDPVTRLLMKRLLTRLGCTVQVAEDGEAALELILATSPDWTNKPTPSSERSIGPILEQEVTDFPPESRYHLIFLDNQMPKMSGLTVVGKLRELGRQDFVVGLTGNALLSDQKEYTDAGANHVLTKPVLERSIKEMLILAEERRRPAVP